MKVRKHKIGCILLITLFFMSGCASSYNSSIEGQKSARQSHSLSLSSLPSTFSIAIEKISSLFESEYRKNSAINQSKLSEKIFYDESGKKTHSEIVYSPRNDLVDYLIAEKKQKTMEMLFSSLQNIYEYKEWEDPNTVTWENVALELIKQGPLMLAIGGLWNIGVESVSKIGDQIENYGNYAKDGSKAGDIITNTITNPASTLP